MESEYPENASGGSGTEATTPAVIDMRPAFLAGVRKGLEAARQMAATVELTEDCSPTEAHGRLSQAANTVRAIAAINPEDVANVQ